MPLTDVVQAALSRPVARALEGTLRELIEEVLQDHGYASPEETDRLRHALREAEDRLGEQSRRLESLESLADSLEARVTSSASSSSAD
jgi:3-methyladenine DNA glycosylase/8-oxoguanine DNA glycosylase